MTDRRARDKLVELIRNLADGIITNDEFEDRLYGSDLPRRKDAAIGEIYAGGAWYMYDDLSTHKMTGKWKLPKASKEIVARWILFLKSVERKIRATLTSVPRYVSPCPLPEGEEKLGEIARRRMA
jgi:hypothetical protein